MTTMRAIAALLGLVARSFSVKEKTNRPDISTKRIPPRSMTQQELEYYKIHRNLHGFSNSLSSVR